MRFNTALTKAVCCVLVVTQISLGFYNISWAAGNSIKQEGHDAGFDYLKAAQEGARNLQVSENGDIKFGNDRLDSITNEDGSAFNTSQLSPDSAHPENADKYYVSGELPSVEDMKGVSGADETTLNDLGESGQDTLEKDAQSDSPTVQGMVYGVLNDLGNQKRPNLGNDPILTNSRDVLENIKGNPFTDCSIDYEIMNRKRTAHTEELKTCRDQQADKCTITHDPVLTIFKYNNNKAVYGICGDHCITYYLGVFPYNSRDPLKPGGCSSGTSTTELQLFNKDAVIKASIERVDYAGSVFATMPSKTGTSDKVLFGYDSDGDTLHSANQMNCSSYAAANSAYPQADITDLVKSSQNGEIFTFNLQYRGAVPYAALNVTYDPTRVARNDIWQGENECLLQAEAIHSGELSGTVKCTSDILTQNGTVILAGVQLEPRYLNQSYGLAGSCTKAEVTVNLSSIEQSSSSNLKGQPLCADLEKQGCGFVSSRCLKYGSDDRFHGSCLYSLNTYDCGYASDVEVPHTVETYACPGAVACMGTDCLDIIIGGDDAEKDFNKALGLLQESQQAANDMSCTHTGEYDEDGNEIFDCALFGGEAAECRNSWSSIQEILGCDSCCSGAPVSGDWAKVVEQTLMASKIGAVKMLAVSNDLTGLFEQTGGYASDVLGWFEDTANFAGTQDLSMYGMGWDLIKNFTGIGNKLDSVARPLANSLNNLIPYAGEVFMGVYNYSQSLIITYVMNEYVVPAMMKMVSAAIGSAAAGAAAGGTAGAASASSAVEKWATDKLVEMGMEQATAQSAVAFVGAAVSVIGWVYAIYSAAKMIAAMTCQCDEDEFQLQSNIMVKKCDAVGSYCSKDNKLLGCVERSKTFCCFESPLSRILNKQIKYSLKGCGRVLWPANNPGCAFGPDGEHPDCSPVTMEQLEEVDWTQVDLTEWLELLKASDVLASDDISLDGLSDNFLPAGGYDKNGNALK